MKRKTFKKVLCHILIVVTVMLTMCSSALAGTLTVLKVTEDFTNLHTTASGSVKDTLRKGTKVLYLGVKENQMCKIITRGGEIGWVYKPYVEKCGTIDKSRIGKTTESIYLYKKNGNSYKKSRTLSAGTMVYVYSVDNGVAKIQTLGGKKGYVNVNKLKKVY